MLTVLADSAFSLAPRGVPSRGIKPEENLPPDEAFVRDGFRYNNQRRNLPSRALLCLTCSTHKATLAGPRMLARRECVLKVHLSRAGITMKVSLDFPNKPFLVNTGLRVTK